MSSITSDSSDEGAPIFPEIYEENTFPPLIKDFTISNEIIKNTLLLGIYPPVYHNYDNQLKYYSITCSIYRIHYLITQFFNVRYPGSILYFDKYKCSFYIKFSEILGISTLQINIFKRNNEITETYIIFMKFERNTGEDDYTIIEQLKEVLGPDYNA